jgi:hypothetical protein
VSALSVVADLLSHDACRSRRDRSSAADDHARQTLLQPGTGVGASQAADAERAAWRPVRSNRAMLVG